MPVDLYLGLKRKQFFLCVTFVSLVTELRCLDWVPVVQNLNSAIDPTNKPPSGGWFILRGTSYFIGWLVICPANVESGIQGIQLKGSGIFLTSGMWSPVQGSWIYTLESRIQKDWLASPYMGPGKQRQMHVHYSLRYCKWFKNISKQKQKKILGRLKYCSFISH